MVQAGSAADYDDVMDEHRPELRAVPRPEDLPDEGLQAAVRGLVDSVNSTSRQFADAAEAFARETMRVMESFASRAEHSAGESRDMADVAGRAAEEARGLSESLAPAMAAAREQLQADVERLIGELRPQIDDAVQAAVEAVAGARTAAEEAQQRTREAYDRIEQSLGSSREAAAAAEAAAEAARHSAESIENAAAQARESLRDEVNRLDADVASRIEQSLAAGRDASSAARSAAEDARGAALEAMSHANEARTPALEAATDSATHVLLDRLEADYQLIAELIQGLHARIVELGQPAQPQAAPAYAPEAGEPASYAPPAIEEDGPAQADPGWAPDAPSWPEAAAEETAAASPADAWKGWGTPRTSESGGTAITEPSSWPYSPRSSPSEREDVKTAETEEHWAASALPPQETARAEWTEHAWPASEPKGIEAEAAAPPEAEPETIQAAEAQSPIENDSSPWSSASPVISQPVSDESHWQESPATVSEEPRDEVEIVDAPQEPAWSYEPPADSWQDGEPAAEAEAPAPGWTAPAEPESADTGPASASMLAGRLVLSVAPVPDFDRLLSLDGALGRLDFVSNVTLADYAKEEVTFRVELGMSIGVEDFTGELERAYGHPIVVVSKAPGQLQLRIAGAA